MFSFYKDKSVLITGHTGFKGAWLVALLDAFGARVSGFALEPDGFSAIYGLVGGSLENDLRGDIRNLSEIEEAVTTTQPDIVFHLAAQPIVRLSYSDPLGTLTTNVTGTAHVLDALRRISPGSHCVVVTSDKCYENRSWDYAYRESDHLGGHDVYSASKGAAEIIASSWRRSFFENADVPGRVATARGGNVIGGGDFAENRIIPDAARALKKKESLGLRNPAATRPWQHVLDCLFGYLTLGEWLFSDSAGASPDDRAFNFGPEQASEQSVERLIREFMKHCPVLWEDLSDPSAPHEADRLRISSDKAAIILGWRPRWGFERSVFETGRWYKAWADGATDDQLRSLVEKQIQSFSDSSLPES